MNKNRFLAGMLAIAASGVFLRHVLTMPLTMAEVQLQALQTLM